MVQMLHYKFVNLLNFYNNLKGKWNSHWLLLLYFVLSHKATRWVAIIKIKRKITWWMEIFAKTVLENIKNGLSQKIYLDGKPAKLNKVEASFTIKDGKTKLFFNSMETKTTSLNKKYPCNLESMLLISNMLQE